MNYKTLPKVELHIHLDCSLSYDVVRLIDPSIDEESYKENFIAPVKCTDLVDYLKWAIKGYELMQTKEALHLVTLDVIDQLKKDHVIYAEVRFAPLQHLQKGLSPEEVVQSVLNAISEGVKKYDIEVNVILCTLRHYSEAQSLKTIELVHHFKDTRVVGFDIAGDEAGFPIDNHIKAFQYAQDHGIPCTAHAGEAKGAQSVWETLEYFRPARIGHGVRSIEDDRLISFLKSQDIHLEVCPTSNIQTNVFEAIKNHPANVLFDKGVSMSINTDARTISNVTLIDEYALLTDVFDWTLDHFKKCNLEAMDHAFTSDEVKQRIRRVILNSYKEEI